MLKVFRPAGVLWMSSADPVVIKILPATQEKGKKGWPGKKKGNKGKRGKFKDSWSKEDRIILWECYVRSGGVKSEGYIKKVREMWDGRDQGVRSDASLLSQLKQIESNSLLSVMERGEIEQRVKREREIDEEEEEASGDGIEGKGNEREVELEDVEVWDQEEGEVSRDEEGEVDFGVDVIERVIVEGELKEGELKKGNVVSIGIKLEMKREPIWKRGDEVRALKEEEVIILTKLREVFESKEVIDIPNLKTKDGREIGETVRIVDGLLHNFLAECTTVTEVNRLIYAGSYMVADNLGMLGKNKKERGDAKKPWWQRRLEKSIVEWRQDLGRVEEISNGTVVKQKVHGRLNRKYQLVEKGALAVSTLLKEKLRQLARR